MQLKDKEAAAGSEEKDKNKTVTEDENDIMSKLTYRKLEMIYNDYSLMGGSKNELDI